MSDQSLISFRSTPDQCKIKPRSILDQTQINVRSNPDQCQIKARSMLDQSQIVVRSILDQSQIKVILEPDRFFHNNQSCELLKEINVFNS